MKTIRLAIAASLVGLSLNAKAVCIHQVRASLLKSATNSEKLFSLYKADSDTSQIRQTESGQGKR